MDNFEVDNPNVHGVHGVCVDVIRQAIAPFRATNTKGQKVSQ